MVVTRTYLYHPELITHLIAICTPYAAPIKTYLPLDEVVKVVPNFRYQVQFAGPDVEGNIQGKEKIRQLFVTIFGGTSDTGERAFSVGKGFHFDNLGKMKKSRLLNEKVGCEIPVCVKCCRRLTVVKELDYYVDQYSRNGLHGPSKTSGWLSPPWAAMADI